LPPDLAEVFEVVAKALMLRLGDSVHLERDELVEAAETSTEIALTDSGTVVFRVERN
jgi:hypothetical protein